MKRRKLAPGTSSPLISSGASPLLYDDEEDNCPSGSTKTTSLNYITYVLDKCKTFPPLPELKEKQIRFSSRFSDSTGTTGSRLHFLFLFFWLFIGMQLLNVLNSTPLTFNFCSFPQLLPCFMKYINMSD